MLPRFLTLVAALLAAVAAGGAAAAWPSGVAWAVLAGVSLVGAWRPAVGLMLMAAFAPLGGAIAALGGLPTSAAEPMLLAVVAGWLLRRTFRLEGWDVTAVSLAGLLAATVLASLAVQCAVAFQVAAPPGLTFPRALLQWLTQTSDVLGPRPEVPAALRLLGGCALFAMAVEVCRREALTAAVSLRLLTLSVAAVAILNINRFIEVALRAGGDFWATALHVHQFLRISSTIPDVNAAGGLFALVLPPALWLCVVNDRRRWMWSAVALSVAAGLWLSGSRAAMTGGFVGVLGYLALAAHQHWSWRGTLVTMTVLLTLGTALIVWYPRAAAHATSHDAWVIRRELIKVGFQMAREAPVFGIGVGRFFEESARFASPELQRHYAAQNAHNQFVQVLGELGILGLGLFLAVIGCTVIPACRQAGRPPPPAMLAPVVVGLVGFLVAGLLMHPLLLPEVSAAFWLALGLGRSAQVVAPIDGTPLRLRVLVPALIALGLIVSLPARITAARHAVNLDGVGVGLSHWRRDGDSGLWYRRARGSSTIYVDGRPGRLRVPLRLVGSRGLPTDVEFWLDGRPAGSLSLASDGWRQLSIALPEPATRTPRFRRLDFRWTPARARSRLDIGRETYLHDGDQPAPQ